MHNSGNCNKIQVIIVHIKQLQTSALQPCSTEHSSIQLRFLHTSTYSSFKLLNTHPVMFYSTDFMEVRPEATVPFNVRYIKKKIQILCSYSVILFYYVLPPPPQAGA